MSAMEEIKKDKEELKKEKTDTELQELKRKELKLLMAKDINCSICLTMFVKPITLVCGHT